MDFKDRRLRMNFFHRAVWGEDGKPWPEVIWRGALPGSDIKLFWFDRKFFIPKAIDTEIVLYICPIF